MSIFSNPANSSPSATAAYVDALIATLDQRDPVQVLGETLQAVPALLDGVPPGLASRPEATGKWSMVEVIQHLADAELVGGFRLRMVLAHDRPTLTGYDQDLWALRLGYRDAVLADALDQFLALRRANLRLWEGLTPDDLRRVGLHAERGEESLDRLRRLYAAHDLVHRSQLARIRAAMAPAER